MIRPALCVLLGLTLLSGSFMADRVEGMAPSPGEESASAKRERALREQAKLWQEAERLRRERKWQECQSTVENLFVIEKALLGDSTHLLLYLMSYLGGVQEGRERGSGEQMRLKAVALQSQILRRSSAPLLGGTSNGKLLQQALEVRREILGNEHPWVGLTLVDLSLDQEGQGRLDLARGSLEAAIQIFQTARFEPAAVPLGATDKDLTDAHYHLLRIQLASSNRSAAELLKWVPDKFTEGLRTIRERCAEAQRYERKNEAAHARSLWEDVFNTTRRLQRDISASAPVSSQLAMARQMRPVFDRYLSWASRAKLSEREVASVYGTLCNLKGAVFIHQRRIWVERRHPWLKPFFDLLGEVDRKLARPRGSDKAARNEARSLLICKLALEAELSRRHSKLPQFQPAPPNALLPPGTVLVDYLIYQHFPLSDGRATEQLTEPRLACFLSRHKGSVIHVDLGPLAPVTKAVLRWRRAIQARRGGNVRGMVRKTPELEDGDLPQFILRKHLWEPLGPYLDKAEAILVSPDGVLCSLPFLALPGSKPETYLVEEVPLAIAPAPLLLNGLKRSRQGGESITEFLAKRDSPAFSTGPRPPLAEGPLLVGNIDFAATALEETRGVNSDSAGPRGASAQQFPPLPGTAREVSVIGALFQEFHTGKRGTALTGCLARTAAVREELCRHRWAHLATHGYFIPADSSSDTAEPELRSGLALAGANAPAARSTVREGFLTALEVESLDLARTELVVLSACETGLGDTLVGEGVLGLQRAFQTAGAQTTVTSLWQVHDEATQALMIAFYRNLWGQKLSRIEALRHAQLAMLRGKLYRPPEFSQQAERKSEPSLTPYYWAAFVLSGDWR